MRKSKKIGLIVAFGGVIGITSISIKANELEKVAYLETMHVNEELEESIELEEIDDTNQESIISSEEVDEEIQTPPVTNEDTDIEEDVEDPEIFEEDEEQEITEDIIEQPEDTENIEKEPVEEEPEIIVGWNEDQTKYYDVNGNMVWYYVKKMDKLNRELDHLINLVP